MSVQARFFDAIRNGRARYVRCLGAHVDVNQLDDDGTPAMVLCANRDYEDLETARCLVQLGASIDAQDSRGLTALTYSVCREHREMVRVLLESGADADVMPLYYGDFRAPILIEAAFGCPELTRLLIEHGAAVDAETSSGTTAAEFAAQSGDTESLEQLLTHGARYSNDLVHIAAAPDTISVLYKFTRGQLPAQRRADIAREFLLDYRADFPPEIADLCSQFVSARL